MTYNLFRERLHWLKLFSLTDIRKVFPSFDSRRLVEWQNKGYIKKVINRWYVFTDIPAEEHLLLWTSNRIYHPSYISMETALSYYGLIPEAVYTTTAVSTLKTKLFDTPLGAFSYRHLKPALFFGYQLLNWKGFPIKMAEPEKVILDYFYLNPQLNPKGRLARTSFAPRSPARTHKSIKTRRVPDAISYENPGQKSIAVFTVRRSMLRVIRDR